MERDDYIRHWNSFCGLATELEETERFVFHGLQGDEQVGLIHADVFSDVFRQILMVTCSEFETMCKHLCSANGVKTNNIVDISRCILSTYPNIVNTRIYTKYGYLTPIENWKLLNGKVEGIEWWRAYTAIKHDEKGAFKKATLENTVLALGTLYIIDLYVLKVSSGNLQLAHEFPPNYFRCEYTANYVVTSEGELPDFGNKTSDEIVKETIGKLMDKK